MSTCPPLNMSRRRAVQAALGLASGLAALPAHAEGAVLYGFLPDAALSPVFAALMRAMQGRYAIDLGQRVTYMPGNASGVAIEAAMRRPADGATALMMPSSLMTLTPQVRKLATVDPERDFTAVAAISEVTLVFAVGSAVPETVKTLRQYADWVRLNPMLQNYGVLGLGTTSHFVGASVARSSDLQIKPQAYKSLLSLTEDLAYGNLPAAVMTVMSAHAAAREGQVRVLAVGSDQRWPCFPEVPTLRELGVSAVSLDLTYGVFVRSATPSDTVLSLRDALLAASATPAVVNALQQAQMRAVTGDGTNYPARIARDRAMWAEVLQKQRFTTES